MDDLKRRIDFLTEIDKLKNVFRQSLLTVDQRRENDAEHSWHLCMYAVILEEYAPEGTDMLRCIKMMLVHDLVEIYAGDTYLYDKKGYEDKRQRESAAADKLFAMLDEDQNSYIRGLWEEFEANNSPSSNFANTLDRLQPIMLNYLSRGEKWLVNKVKAEQVLARFNEIAKNADPRLRTFVYELIEESKEKGYINT